VNGTGGDSRPCDGPVTQQHAECGQLTMRGQRTDDDGECSLLVTHEPSGSWTIQGPQAPGVRLSAVDVAGHGDPGAFPVNWRIPRRDYRDAGRHHRARLRRWKIEMIDARTLQAHRLTDEAIAAGRRGERPYVALCGWDVLPASLTEAERGFCRVCAS
jgi:hypothetical protein